MDLGRAIRSLLRPRPYSALGPATPRQPLAARLGVADWSPASEGPVDPGLPGVPTWMDSGWAAWNFEEALRIYTTTAEAAYLSGAGTPIPASSRVEVWAGKVAAHASATCVAGSRAPQWSEAPTLDGDQSHAPLATADDPPDEPSRYTGLARLWAQAVIGSGLSLVSRLPPGWTATPGSLGVLRSPLADLEPDESPTWSLVRVSSAGIFVAPLVLTEWGRCLARWIGSGAITDPDAEARAEAWLLSGATPGDPYQIAADYNMDYMLNHNGPRSPSVGLWGWMWPWQRLGGAAPDQAEISCVAWDGGALEAGTWAIRSRVLRIEFEWSGAAWSVANYVRGAETAWSPGWGTAQTLKIPVSVGHWYRIKPPTGHEISGGGPVACRYLPSGTLEVLRARPPTFSVNEPPEPVWTDYHVMCAGDAKGDGWETSSSSQHGWETSTGSLVAQVYLSQRTESRRFVLTYGGQVTQNPSGWGKCPDDTSYYCWAGNDQCAGSSGEERWLYYQPPPTPRYRHPVGAGTRTESTLIEFAETMTDHLVIGYYPGTWGVHRAIHRTYSANSFTVVSRNADSQLIASSTAGVVLESVGGANRGYARNVPFEVQAGARTTTVTEASKPPPGDPYAAFCDDLGAWHVDTANVAWIDSDIPESAGWRYQGSYQGVGVLRLSEEIKESTAGGVDDGAQAKTWGLWVGGV